MSETLILILRAAAGPAGVTCDGAETDLPSFDRLDILDADALGLIRRHGMAYVWRIMPRGRRHLALNDVSDG